MAARFGYSEADIVATTSWWRKRIHPEDRKRASESIDQAIGDGRTSNWNCEYRFKRRDGSYAEVCDRAYILRDKTGNAIRAVGAVMDLSEITRAYRALEESEERYRYTIELTGQIAWTCDCEGKNLEFDERWSALTGLTHPISQAQWEEVFHPEDFRKSADHWSQSISTGKPLDFEHRLRVYNGDFRWFRSRAAPHRDASGRITRWYGAIEDIHERVSSRLALKKLASIDELTGLPNRRKFSQDLETRFKHCARRAKSMAVLVLDIDDFKSVNDLFGHDAGDYLLQCFAQRTIAAGMELYRIGGDELAAILVSDDRSAPTALAKAIHETLKEPFHWQDSILNCRTSIGCAIYPRHGSSPTELLKSADIASYAAKSAGGGQTRVFTSAMRNELQRRSSMMEVARGSLSADRIAAFFQPKVNLRNGRLVGFEALMRIHNDRFGPQHPGVIAAAFDHPELAIELAERVLNDVMKVARRWREEGLPFGRIAINASPLEFRGGKYADRLLARLRENGARPEDIEVEVTETVFLNQAEDSILQSLRQLKEAGVTVALDDFGTGYASLSHLRQYPVDVLKVDQTFIRELTHEPRQQLITRAIIDLSRTIGIQTVAEGIETVEQADLLQSFGCDLGQGFLFGRALCAVEAEGVLRASNVKPLDTPVKELRAG
jgi:diguanylate cyclase (GGDEF)-like protein/PAS domain S-box-containing protein